MSRATVRVPEGIRGLAARLTEAGPSAFPAYVYDLGELARHGAKIRAALPEGVGFTYAVKANPDAEILRTLAPYLDGLDVASGGELRHVASVLPDMPVAFGGPGKTDAELAEAVRLGVRRVHVESPYELRRLAAAARSAGRQVDILLRADLPLHLPARPPTAAPRHTPLPPPGDTPHASPDPERAAHEPQVMGRGSPGDTPHPSLRDAPHASTDTGRAAHEGQTMGKGSPGDAPHASLGDAAHVSRGDGGWAGGEVLTMGGDTPFGMDPAGLEAALAILPELPELRPRGFSWHLASGLDADGALAVAAEVLGHVRPLASALGLREAEYVLGGGMEVDYAHPDRRFDWARYGAGLARLAAPGERLRIEPGRAVTAYCGWYVTRVIDVKQAHGAAFGVLQGGTHHLRTPVTKGHDQPFAVLTHGTAPDDAPQPVDAPQLRNMPELVDEAVTLTGQLCTPKDVFARKVPVARLRPGDVVAFAMAGAYAWNISHHDFCLHSPPDVHYLGRRP